MSFQLAGMRADTRTCDPEAMLRCLIVDDSPRFLDAARGLLERQGLTVVGVASNSAEALQRVEELRPDVTLLDIDLGGESGLELARRLHQAGRARHR
jgi:CheY-like chemotaxis protein